MIKLIWAMDQNHLIGAKNKLPWKIPEELKHFKDTTWGKTILMGRKTYEGIGKVLPNRTVLVLTSQKEYQSHHQEVKVVNNFDEIVKHYWHHPTEDIYICGGAEIYQTFLAFADQLIISIIKNSYQGDIYFPKFDLSEYNLKSVIEYHEFEVSIYERKDLLTWQTSEK